MPFTVAIVGTDPEFRRGAARAFAGAPEGWTVRLHDDAPPDADVVVVGSDDGTGDVVFDPEDPEDALRAVAERAQRSATNGTFLVTGAAGGVGATAVALHLAAEWGPEACYAELGGRGGSRWFGLPDDARTWLPRDDDLARSALPVGGGFRLLRAPEPCPSPDAFPLDAARASFARLVLDVESGTDLPAACGAGVLVTTPTRPATDAARELLDAHPETRWAVVVNRLGPGGQIMRGGLEALIGRRVAIELPCCPALRDAEDEGRLLTGPWHRWRRALTRLARALASC